MTAPPAWRSRWLSLRSPAGRSPSGALRRRLATTVRLVVGLVLVGGVYAAFAPAASADDAATLSASAAKGQELYEQRCSSCHGVNAEGVDGRGPSLVGVGSAAVTFQVGTGRMPMASQGAQAERKAPAFSPEETADIAAYIQALGGGPQVPAGDDLGQGGDVARGGELFRVNCSSCHAFSGSGGALSSGKFAPTLDNANSRDIWAAMLSGPQNMPVFGDNQLTPDEKRDVIAYIQNLQDDQNPGGWGISGYGPVPEALAIFLIGMVALIFTTVWIAGKS